jgi:hypothetical protein
VLPSIATFANPSAAILDALLAAFDKPLSLKKSTALSTSPPVSTNAFFAVHHTGSGFIS